MSLKEQIEEAKKELDLCAKRFATLAHDVDEPEYSEYYEECEAEYEDAKFEYHRLKSIDNSTKFS